MVDQTNPSQEDSKGGVFGSIQGAHSRDPDVAEEPVKEPVTTEPTEPAKESGEAAKADDGKLGKALQRAAQLERQINQLGPWAQFGMAVGNVKGDGEALVQRYQQGQPLFVSEEGELTTEPTTPNQQPVTEQGINDLMDQREATQRVMRDLNDMAEEELPEFRKISRSQEFVEMLEWARQAVWRGTIPLDESAADMDNEFKAKEYTALKKAYKMRLASDEKVLGAAKKAGERQAKERAEEAAAVPSSTGMTTSSQEEPGEKTEAEELIEGMINVKGRGKSFSTVGSK